LLLMEVAAEGARVLRRREAAVNRRSFALIG
jgi:hypothetical protein